MIGRIGDFHTNPNYVYLIGSDMLSTDLHNLSEEVNKKYINLKLDYTFNAKETLTDIIIDQIIIILQKTIFQ